MVSPSRRPHTTDAIDDASTTLFRQPTEEGESVLPGLVRPDDDESVFVGERAREWEWEWAWAWVGEWVVENTPLVDESEQALMEV